MRTENRLKQKRNGKFRIYMDKSELNRKEFEEFYSSIYPTSKKISEFLNEQNVSPKKAIASFMWLIVSFCLEKEREQKHTLNVITKTMTDCLDFELSKKDQK